eukprot:5568919-Prymnesium_polylepis.2
MSRCPDVPMSRCPDVPMSRCHDAWADFPLPQDLISIKAGCVFLMSVWFVSCLVPPASFLVPVLQVIRVSIVPYRSNLFTIFENIQLFIFLSAWSDFYA